MHDLHIEALTPTLSLCSLNVFSVHIQDLLITKTKYWQRDRSISDCMNTIYFNARHVSVGKSTLGYNGNHDYENTVTLE